jgi:hypothetical protein
MALGDALYSMVISGGRVFKLTKASFSLPDWDGDPNRVASLENMLYVSRIDVITDKDTSATDYFLEAYSAIEDGVAASEGTFLWSFPLDGSNAVNTFTFLQPIQLNTKADFVVRTVDPYPTGNRVNMGTDSDAWLVLVEGYPRNII